MKKVIYQIVDNADGGKVLGELWWDDGLKADSESTLEYIISNYVSLQEDLKNEKFLENLQYRFRNGYTSLRKKEEE